MTSYLIPFRSYRSLLFEFWTLLRFEPPLGVLGTTYDVHLGLIGKLVVDFLLVLTVISISVNRNMFARCYGCGAMSENLMKEPFYTL